MSPVWPTVNDSASVPESLVTGGGAAGTFDWSIVATTASVGPGTMASSRRPANSASARRLINGSREAFGQGLKHEGHD